MSTPPTLPTNAGLLLFSLPSSLPQTDAAAHGFLRSLNLRRSFQFQLAAARASCRSIAGIAALLHTIQVAELFYLQEEARYLGGSGSKKWILAMDGGERPAAAAGQKRPFPPDGELVELLWQDGAVVAHSQAQRAFDAGGASGVTEEAPLASWLPGGGGGGGGMGGDVYSQLWQSIAQDDGRVANSGNSGAGSSRTAGGEVGSSFCGSNLVAAALHLDDDIDDGAALPPPPPMDEPGPSTSSGWNSNALQLKRSRDEFDSRSEDADFDTVDETPASSRRPASKRRTRAAEVHNMSERRRRDRINEKMRALQELVPHCNKTDKASILDETIEYLKSLQMQVQIMWMSTGMAPMMLPGAHQLMPPMTLGLNSACIPPAAQFLSQMQRVQPFMSSPLPNQIPQITSAATNATNQIQSNGLVQPRNPFFHPNDALASTPQVPSLFGYGPQMAQENVIEELLTGTAAPALGAEPPSSSDGTGT